MGLLLRYLPVLVVIGLTIWALVDCLQTPEAEVRALPKVAWVVIILLFDVIGAVAWIAAGRSRVNRPARAPWPSTSTAGFPEYERPRVRSSAPDDDPEFLKKLAADNRDHEDLLRRWEEDLRRREERLRGPDGDEPPPAPAG